MKYVFNKDKLYCVNLLQQILIFYQYLKFNVYIYIHKQPVYNYFILIFFEHFFVLI
jgi:hypothetical protein